MVSAGGFCTCFNLIEFFFVLCIQRLAETQNQSTQFNSAHQAKWKYRKMARVKDVFQKIVFPFMLIIRWAWLRSIYKSIHLQKSRSSNNNKKNDILHIPKKRYTRTIKTQQFYSQMYGIFLLLFFCSTFLLHCQHNIIIMYIFFPPMSA